MPKKVRLLDQVTISELMHMREVEGMSNQEIADALGVHYSTIKGAIGPQPRGLRKPYTKKEYSEQPVKRAEVEPDACLVVQNRTVVLHGKQGAYTIDCKSKLLQIDFGEGAGMVINLPELSDFVNELRAIERKLGELNVQNEMW